ncbi:MAG: hypothetical protein A3J40_01190 [Erythrobacter sp. RIFCSPHIGHO2_12_FULL_63_10]|nr:MAG: hypothetical protein A3J40_01190 [Erythrobacter sp. RIFCSPHIGHO2_12_FULL_63_10]
MAKMKAYSSPDEWFADAGHWQKPQIEALRMAIASAANFEPTIKWGNLVMRHNGPCILIRHEPERVLLGFWRGKRLTAIEPRIKPSGKFELGNIVLRAGDSIAPDQVMRLAREAARLNTVLGNPTTIN